MSEDDPTRAVGPALGVAGQGPKPADDAPPDLRADAVEERAALGRLKSNLFQRGSEPLVLGRYRLDRRLAAGGMGVVYDAWDPELERRVAIKLLQTRGAEASREGRARLLREAQAMARLSHPNIVPVYDVGTYEEDDLAGVDDSGVFVVMELIEGERLDTWLRSSPRGLREILDVFRSAGEGLRAAHEGGIVHRDFKPTNVIVGGDGRVRVLDFGLAAARGATPSAELDGLHIDPTPSGLSTPLTMTGSVMGTPAYMAPEQHEGRPADARADQFSFCVALFEALHGARPFQQSTMEELSRAKAAGEILALPTKRGLPKRVDEAVRRGLCPDPGDRHPDLAALLRKLAPRRVSGALLAGAIGAAAVLGGGAVWLASPAEDPCAGHEALLDQLWTEEIRATSAGAFGGSSRPYAADTWRDVEVRIEARFDAWSGLRRETCEAALVRGDATTEWMHRVDACADRHLARVSALVEVLAEADDAVVDGAIEAVASLPDVRECEHAPLDVEPEIPGELRVAVAQADTAIAAAEAMIQAARYTQANARAEAATALAVQTGHAPVVARAMVVTAKLDVAEGRHAEATDQLREAILEAERGGDALTAVDAMITRAASSTRLARHEDAAADLDMAEARIVGRGLSRRWRFELLRTRGGLLSAQGKLPLARQAQQEALALGTELYGSEDLRVADNLNALGAVEQESGRLETSLAHYRAAHRVFEKILGAKHPDVAMVENNLGNIALAQEDLDAALEHFERAHASWSEAYGPEHPRVGDSLNNLGNLLARRGELDRAFETLTRAHEIWRKRFGEDHPTVGISLLNLSGVLLEQEKLEEAREHGERAVRVIEGALGSDHPHVAYALIAQADALVKLDATGEARTLLERAISIFERSVDADSKPLQAARELLASLDE